MRRILSRRGSSTVLLAMVFLAFAICITGSITIARRLVVKSECESFGRIWTKAILSEYDRHLLEDYGIMAYFGDENEVNRTIDDYISYSASGKLDARFGGTVSELSGYELGDPENFENAMMKGLAGRTVSALINGRTRHKRGGSAPAEDGHEPTGDEAGNRKIGNTVVLDTLPSAGMGSSYDADSIAERLKSIGSSEGIRAAISGAGAEMAFIWEHFGNSVTTPDDKDSFYTNEWEYILGGNADESKNYSSCRKKLFVIRNALNLASIYKDPEKVELITTAAEVITPGPLGAATQLLIAEAWAALETEEDLKDLYNYERVPVLKNAAEWKTGFGSALNSESVRKKLDEEARTLLDENSEELGRLSQHEGASEMIRDGLNYDEYLMFMMLTMKRETRILRVMDLVQINMKYRYYRDFDLMEYFIGVRFTIKANGHDYCFEDSYK